MPAVMIPISFSGWSLSFDREATRSAHNAAGIPGAEACGCRDCLNYAQARHSIQAPDLRGFLEQVGVPAFRDSRVSELGPWQSGTHTPRLYIILFHFVGEILLEPAQNTEGVTFRPRTYPLPASFNGLAVVELSFTAAVPWVLSVPPPD